jgi:hypothetical protein
MTTADITVKNDLGPTDDVNKFFHLSFNTATHVAKLEETGGPDTSTLTGIIQTSTVSPTSVILTIAFNSLPLDFQNFLGTPNGAGLITTVELGTGAVQFATAVISPTPEPGSYLLMGTGMLLCGLVLRYRKGNSQATAVTA